MKAPAVELLNDTTQDGEEDGPDGVQAAVNQEAQQAAE
jgi:hypothetical protein